MEAILARQDHDDSHDVDVNRPRDSRHEDSDQSIRHSGSDRLNKRSDESADNPRGISDSGSNDRLDQSDRDGRDNRMEEHGLADGRFLTHSLRRGGVCALLMAGMSKEDVMHFERWKSQSGFEKYVSVI